MQAVIEQTYIMAAPGEHPFQTLVPKSPSPDANNGHPPFHFRISKAAFIERICSDPLLRHLQGALAHDPRTQLSELEGDEAARTEAGLAGLFAQQELQRITHKDWNCDLCNAEYAAGTESASIQQHDFLGEFYVCRSCVGAGRSASDHEVPDYLRELYSP